MKATRNSRISRTRIIEASLEEVQQHGFASLSLRKVAAKLDCAAPSIYYHFRNKDALINAIWEWKYGELEQYCQSSSSVTDYFYLFGKYWLENPQLFKIMFLTDSVNCEGATPMERMVHDLAERLKPHLPLTSDPWLTSYTMITATAGIIYGQIINPKNQIIALAPLDQLMALFRDYIASPGCQLSQTAPAAGD